MNPEERSLLERAVRLSEENNRIVKKMLTSMRWARVIRILYWVILIGISIGAFYFIQPYIDQIISVYGQVYDTGNQFNETLQQFRQ